MIELISGADNRGPTMSKYVGTASRIDGLYRFLQRHSVQGTVAVSVRKISRELNYDPASTRDYLRRLAKNGLIAEVASYARHQPRTYTVI